MEKICTLFGYISSHQVVIIYKHVDKYNVNTWLYILLCSTWDTETCTGAMFNQCILSCVLMAAVYIHNTITWIQTWQQCVVFLQQIATSKYTQSWCTFTTGTDNYHTKTKKCNEMLTMYCTFSILMCSPPSSYNSHNNLHICTQPKSKPLDPLH